MVPNKGYLGYSRGYMEGLGTLNHNIKAMKALIIEGIFLN